MVAFSPQNSTARTTLQDSFSYSGSKIDTPLKPDSQGQLWCCLIFRKLSILQTVQPSPSCRDSPSFAWKSLIPTNMSIRIGKILILTSLVIFSSDDFRQKFPCQNTRMGFQSISISNYFGGAFHRPPWWPLPSAIAWFVGDQKLSWFHILTWLDCLITATLLLFSFFQVFEFQIFLF